MPGLGENLIPRKMCLAGQARVTLFANKIFYQLSTGWTLFNATMVQFTLLKCYLDSKELFAEVVNCGIGDCYVSDYMLLVCLFFTGSI